MKVALIAPPIMDVLGGRLRPVGVDALRECPPVGIYALASLLEEAGHEVVLADLVQAGTNDLSRLLPDLSGFDLLGISATSMSWPTAVDVIAQIRAAGCEAPIVCGGIHASLFDAHILESFPVDFVIRGEGEIPMLRLCAALEGKGALAGVPNLTWRGPDGGLIRNPEAARFHRDELAELPLPDFGRLEAGAYKCLALESSRGCAFDCSFCSTPYRKSWRALPPEAFVTRLKTVMTHLPRVRSDCIHIVDDEFALNPKRAMKIADLLEAAGIQPELLFDARAPDVVTPGFLERYAPLTAGMLIGAECGYDAGLKRIGKGTSCGDLEAAAAALAGAGIAERVDFSFILGLPWEGMTEIEKTIRFATRLYAEHGVHVMLQWYRQIPGSRLWAEAAGAGKVTPAMYDGYGFFGDYELFSTACRLSPDEIYEVGDLLDRVGWIAGLHGRARPTIAHSLPAAVTDRFPRDPRNRTSKAVPTGAGAHLPLQGAPP